MNYFITRLSVSLIFLYHGIIPKLIFSNGQEVLMNDEFIPFLSASNALLFSGIAEVLYGIMLIVFYRSRLLMYPAMAFSVFATLVLLVKFPTLFQNAFNPFSTNLSIFVLALLNVMQWTKSTNAVVK